jgi:hypothetical protein
MSINMKKPTCLQLLPNAAVLLVLATGCNLAPGFPRPAQAPMQANPAASAPASMEETPSIIITTAPQKTVESSAGKQALAYPVVDTSQGKCYDNNAEISCPAEGSAFYGQDAQYAGLAASYRDNGDGTVSDLVTGLMWQKDPGQKVTFDEGMQSAGSFALAGYNDWRVPTIKELYSLILFDGTDVSGCSGTCSVTPFIDARYFKFSYGDESAGERTIDSQFMSSTTYVARDAASEDKVFGVNFADGRIKGYGLVMRNTDKKFYLLHVRGGSGYGVNKFVDAGDGTIRDEATGLVWAQVDSAAGMDWASALDYCEKLSLAGENDWRLPDVKELQSIVDYSRSPSTSASAAVDPLFKTSPITNEAGQADYPYYWSSTTHSATGGHGAVAAYIAFGRAMGYMGGWVDVHGAGAQRSHPKTGSASQFPQGRGPQGDSIRVLNYARCVRAGNAALQAGGGGTETRPAMTIQSSGLVNQPGASTGQSLPGGAPPKEAVTACSSLTSGAACQVKTPRGTILNGTCVPVQQILACVPAGQSAPGMQP